jgi:S-DNA-T family DNA segregation ATPase FtsK/SpoIIIE
MLIPAAILALAGVVGLVWLAGHAVRYLATDRSLRPVLRRAWRIKYTWKRTARRVSLVQTERTRPPWWSNRPATAVIVRELIPAIRVAVEPWGVRVDASTVGKLGVEEFQNAASHLADVWRVGQVRVEQARPGLVRLRVLITDPLTSHTRWTADATDSAGPALWLAGVDADGQPVTIRSSGVSGVVVAGLAGYGKTSFSMPVSARSLRRRRCSSCSSTARAAPTMTTCSPARGPPRTTRTSSGSISSGRGI